MYQALYRKWRPRTFDDVVGQSHITDTLKRQVATGRLSHAYLFTGTRGTGKTTCAKILARVFTRSEEHTSELQSLIDLVCRLLLEKNFFNDTATTEIYTLSLHDALPILSQTFQPHPFLTGGKGPGKGPAAVQPQRK